MTLPAAPRRMRLAVLRGLAWLAISAVVFGPVRGQPAAPAPPWVVETIPTRILESGERARLAVAVRAPSALSTRHVVLYPSPNAEPLLKVASGTTALNLTGPWVRVAGALNERGVAVAFADVPSDVRRTAPGARIPGEMRRDLQAVVNHLRSRFPGAAVHLGLFANNVAPVLDVAAPLDGVGRIVGVSGGFLDSCASDWGALRAQVLLVHAPTSTCEVAPFLEARLVARRARAGRATSRCCSAPAPALPCTSGYSARGDCAPCRRPGAASSSASRWATCSRCCASSGTATTTSPC